MLRYLEVKNLALVNQVKLDFDAGLNVITGETGAGKSVLINALNAVLGRRFSKNWIGSFSNETIIFALFDLTNKPKLIKSLRKIDLLDNDLSTAESREISIRRVINQSGISRNYVNGQKISLKELAQITENLVDVHSQNSQQSLLNNSFQRDLLDLYAKLENKSHLKVSYEKIKKINQAIVEAQNTQSNPEKKQLLEYYLEELNDANLENEELVNIENNYKESAQIKQIVEDLTDAEKLINWEESGINQQTLKLSKLIDQITKHNPNFAENSELVEQIQIATSTIEENIDDYYQKLESSKSLEYLEMRLNLLDKLARKHSCSIKNLIQVHQRIKKELSTLDGSLKKLDLLKIKKQELIRKYKKQAIKISALREQKAKELEKKIEIKLKTLALAQGKIRIEIITDTELLSPNGFDRVEFKVSLNKKNPTNRDFLALKEVASGGEISRIALAIETELAFCTGSNTLVFDEVDTGIGGDVANHIGINLKELSLNHQVICITHLAQIAVYANTHQVVEKELTKELNKETQNKIMIKKLNKKTERIEEISRMISGHLFAETSSKHAKNMLNFAQNNQ